MGAAEFKYANGFVDRLFGEGLHAKRVQSLTSATVGVMTSASLAVSTIGHGLALAQGGISKHDILVPELIERYKASRRVRHVRARSGWHDHPAVSGL